MCYISAGHYTSRPGRPPSWLPRGGAAAHRRASRPPSWPPRGGVAAPLVFLRCRLLLRADPLVICRPLPLGATPGAHLPHLPLRLYRRLPACVGSLVFRCPLPLLLGTQAFLPGAAATLPPSVSPARALLPLLLLRRAAPPNPRARGGPLLLRQSRQRASAGRIPSFSRFPFPRGAGKPAVRWERPLAWGVAEAAAAPESPTRAGRTAA